MLLTKQQKLFLLRLIKAKKHILFTPFDGVNVTFEKKRQSWQWILEQLRANGVNYNRDIMYLRYTTWSNLKRTTLSKVYSRQNKPNGKIFNEKDSLVFEIIGQEEVSRAFLKDNNSIPAFFKSEPLVDLTPEPDEQQEKVSVKESLSNEVIGDHYDYSVHDQINSCYDSEQGFQVQNVDMSEQSPISESPNRHQLRLTSLIETGIPSQIKPSFTTSNMESRPLNIARTRSISNTSNTSPILQNDQNVESAKTEYYRAMAHKQKLEILQMELQMKLDPRYSRENGILKYYEISSSHN